MEIAVVSRMLWLLFDRAPGKNPSAGGGVENKGVVPVTPALPERGKA